MYSGMNVVMATDQTFDSHEPDNSHGLRCNSKTPHVEALCLKEHILQGFGRCSALNPEAQP